MDKLSVGDTVELRHSAEFTQGTVTKLIGDDQAAVRWATRTGYEGKTIIERISDLRRVTG